MKVYDDSTLVIYQLQGDWITRDSKLILYYQFVTKMIKCFEEIAFNYLPREENQMVDALATLAAMFKVNLSNEVQLIRMSIREDPAHCVHIKEETDGKPWYYDILQYLKDRQYPKHVSENDKRTLRRLVMEFFLDGDVLYKRGKDQVLLRCVDSAEARRILEEVYEGICGTHASGHRMARQIMRAGYYWLTLERDCIEYARKCHKCQISADKIHMPCTELHVLAPPWPFSMWGMDVIGPITPKASNGHQFIFVVIDYFIK